jgi:hypothetical protein
MKGPDLLPNRVVIITGRGVMFIIGLPFLNGPVPTLDRVYSSRILHPHEDVWCRSIYKGYLLDLVLVNVEKLTL